jgi:glutaredoxin 3
MSGVIVYTLENCGYCKVAKELLQFKGVSYSEVKVPHDISTRDFISEYPTVKSFPLIVDETTGPIGGFTDLQEWLLQQEQKQFLTEKVSGLSI